ncbi:hypothetical protein MMC18_008325 [Xylographa bjoerkii]|nr:hypothetical protein [Xylographa bjoerkii]
MDLTIDELTQAQSLIQMHTTSILSNSPPHKTLPLHNSIATASRSLLSRLPFTGHGLEKTASHLIEAIVPGLNGSSLSPNYYGFVTGGATPAARLADNLVTLYDQNAAVHLPKESIATVVEDRALVMLLDLLQFDHDRFKGRIFTTGATSSNILGLACGREWILQKKLIRASVAGAGICIDSVGELGLLEACKRAGVESLQILTTVPHSSLRKAASVLGMGRTSVIDVGHAQNPLVFDMQKLEEMLSRERSASIVVVSCGEVNTGGFATQSSCPMQQVRTLCDKYDAWLHVDGAFGVFARALTGHEYRQVASGAQDLHLADSITGDAHKLLNVPYDCGFFFCAYSELAQQIFQNPNAAYLNAGPAGLDSIPSPLNIGIENSRRFRGLPVYATLMAYGRAGYVDMLERQVRFARAVANYLDHHDDFEILPENLQGSLTMMKDIFIIVLFRAKDDDLNRELVSSINASSKIYVSGTMWSGSPASRIAVSNWQVDPSRDLAIVKAVLEGVLTTWQDKLLEATKTNRDA